MAKTLLRKIKEKPFVALNIGLSNLYSIFLYPFRICKYKRLGFLSRIHPLSSINNPTHVSIGSKTVINRNVILWTTNLEVGDYVQINPGVAIYGNVKIGNYVMIAPNCMIAGGNHGMNLSNIPMRFQPSFEKGIVIEDDVWIGANTTILDGVKIEEGCVVGAGSVVTNDIPKYSIAIGNPAKVVKQRI